MQGNVLINHKYPLNSAKHIVYRYYDYENGNGNKLQYYFSFLCYHPVVCLNECFMKCIKLVITYLSS